MISAIDDNHRLNKYALFFLWNCTLFEFYSLQAHTLTKYNVLSFQRGQKVHDFTLKVSTIQNETIIGELGSSTGLAKG